MYNNYERCFLPLLRKEFFDNGRQRAEKKRQRQNRFENR